MVLHSILQSNSWYNYGTVSPNNNVLYVAAYTGPSSNLISYNPSTGATWFDISSNNNNMSLIGNYSFTGSENAISFTGSTNVSGGYSISPNLYNIFNLNNFNQTQEIWFKNVYYSATGTQGVLISELGTSTINNNWHDSQVEIVGKTGYISVWSSAGINKLGVGNVNDQNWHCIGWRYSSTGLLSGFFDGVLVNQLVVSRLNPTPGYYVALAVTDSTSLGNGNYFSGLIGAYRTYNRTLSNQEILQNYNYEKQFFGITRSNIKVNIVGPGDPASWYQDVLSKIATAMTGSYSNKTLTITQNNSSSYVGSDLTTTNYDCVFIWTNGSYTNSSLGTNLQNYIISGGNLVICVFASASVRLPVTFDYAYTPCVYPGNQTMASTGLGTYDSSDSLMKNVISFNPGTSKYGANGLTLQSGATAVARYNDNNILVAKKIIGKSRTVTLNFFPPSSNIRSDLWLASTDGGKLMANAIVWTGFGSN
jgi:hypothetical protein